jgi:hypothetical protein
MIKLPRGLSFGIWNLFGISPLRSLMAFLFDYNKTPVYLFFVKTKQ